MEPKIITDEEISVKESALANKFGGCKAIAYDLKDGDGKVIDRVVGFLAPVTRDIMMAVLENTLDKIPKIKTGETILRACLIPEESDSRILDSDPRYDAIFVNACLQGFAWNKSAGNTYKKKEIGIS
jgi:hypothetical protein